MDDVSAIELQVLECMLADLSGEEGIAPIDKYLEAFADYEDLVLHCFDRITGKIENPIPPSPGIQPPDSLGPFLLKKVAGRGGQGVVWQAEDPRLGRTVALKVLSPQAAFFDHATRERLRKRFEREANVASRIDAPGICTVYEIGESGDIPWIAMQWIPGQSLDLVIDSCRDESPGNKPLWHKDLGTSVQSLASDRIRAILKLFIGAAEGVHAAHLGGLVHRDLKPGNLMLTPTGDAVVLDFGLALDDSHDGAALTLSHEIMGSPAYMSPEQLEGKLEHLDKRTDIYSLGVTLYECLSCRRPFEEPTRERLFQAIRFGRRPDLRRIVPAVSRDLALVINCATDPKIQCRYETAADFAADLGRVLARQPIMARPRTVAVQILHATRSHPTIATAIAMLLLLTASIATVLKIEASKLAETNQELTARNQQLQESQTETQTAVLKAEEREKEARWSSFVARMRAANAHFDNNEFGEAKRQLEACPEEFRGFAWDHLSIAMDETQEDLGHSQMATASADGKVVANAINSRMIQILNGSTGLLQHQLEALPEDQVVMRINALGNRLVSLSLSGRLSVFDLPAARPTRTIEPVEPSTALCSMSPNGRYAAMRGLSKLAHILDLDTGEKLFRLPNKIGDVIFLDNHHLLTTGISQGIKVWTIPDRGTETGRETGREIASFGSEYTTGHWTRRFSALAVSQDGQMIAAATPGARPDIMVFKPDGTVIQTLRSVHGSTISHLAFHPTRKYLLSSGSDYRISIWDISKGVRKHTVSEPWVAHTITPWFAPDDQSILVSSRFRLRRFGANCGLAQHRLAEVSGSTLAISASGTSLYVGQTFGRKVLLCNPKTGRHESTLHYKEGLFNKLSVDPHGKFIALGFMDGAVRIFDKDRQFVASLEAPSPASPPSQPSSPSGSENFTPPRILAFSPSTHTLIRVTHEGLLTAYDTINWTETHRDQGGRDVRVAQFSHDGHTLFIAVGSSVHALDTHDLSTRYTLHSPTLRTQIDHLTVDQDTQWLATGSRNLPHKIQVWDLSKREVHHALTGFDRGLIDLEFDPTGNRLATASGDQTLRIWDTESGELLMVRRFEKPLSDLLFDPQGQRLWLLTNQPIALETIRPPPKDLATRGRVHTLQADVAPTIQTQFGITGRSLRQLESLDVSDDLRDEVARFLANSIIPNIGAIADKTDVVIHVSNLARRFLMRPNRSISDTWAQDWCSIALRHAPDHSPMRASLGLALCRAGEYDQASIELEKAVQAKIDPKAEPSFLYSVLALAEWGRGQPEAARTALAQARSQLTRDSSDHAVQLVAEATSVIRK